MTRISMPKPRSKGKPIRIAVDYLRTCHPDLDPGDFNLRASRLESGHSRVTATDLAVMAATLANDGVNPLTGERALPAEYIPDVLTVMKRCIVALATNRI